MLDIKIDSRKVVPGDTFVAIKGKEKDGHKYINEAIRNGASKVIVSKPVDFPGNITVVDDTTLYLQEYLEKQYSHQINTLTIIGITGTNGKTTTASFTYQLLKELGVKSAYIGTLGYTDEEENIPLLNTTPDIITLYELLLHARNKGIKIVALEVSSHALKQGRVHGITFSYAGFTNITQEHLDYHRTMEDYLQSKMLITKQVRSTGKIVINEDDTRCDAFKSIPYISIGKTGQDYQLLGYQYQYPYSYVAFSYQKEYQLDLPIFGEFNMYNYIMAVAFIHDMGYSIGAIIKASRRLEVPSGRCSLFTLEKGKAIIDYAHTPDAVLQVLQSLNMQKKGRLLSVIGCGGERDQQKRPLMGTITTTHSDFVIFTNDNPRREDPNIILNQITSSIETDNYVVMPNRKDAIKQAISILEEEDIVVVFGKGHENYQWIGEEKIPYSDIEEMKKYSKEKRS